MFIVSYLLVFCAAFFKACADAFENTPNFDESIFNKWDKKFWCKDVSWEYAQKLSIKVPFIKKRIGSYKLDSWHISISLMVFSMAGAIVVYKPHHEWWVHYSSIGVIWNMTFWLFYHKIFQVK
jgi:hypothetical protein